MCIIDVLLKCGQNKTLACVFITCVDVISIEKTGENFRLMFDVKGRFTVHRISKEEAKVCTTAARNTR